MQIPQPHQITPPVNLIGFWQGKTAELWQCNSFSGEGPAAFGNCPTFDARKDLPDL
jgi:hypothetical protein